MNDRHYYHSHGTPIVIAGVRLIDDVTGEPATATATEVDLHA